jgi:hypothetical protein
MIDPGVKEEVSRVPGRRVDTGKSDELPYNEHNQSKTQNNKERNV